MIYLTRIDTFPLGTKVSSQWALASGSARTTTCSPLPTSLASQTPHSVIYPRLPHSTVYYQYRAIMRYNDRRMAIHLMQFEAFAETVLHDLVVRWLHERLQPHDLAVQLTRAIEDAQRSGPQGEAYAPDRFWIYLHADDLAFLRAEQPALENALAESVVAIARQADMHLARRPTVSVEERPGQSPRTVGIVARVREHTGDSTLALSRQERAAIESALCPPAAYLVVDGRRVVPLEKAFITLGRRADNDIIVDDPRVSRRHAQIRCRYGHHIVFDLGSRGGTFVNGERISECALTTGDVISLAGCDLIYGEEDTLRPASPPTRSQAPSDHTQALPPADAGTGPSERKP